MPTRRVIRGVLGNFLGTFVCRHSDYQGLLLFGFLVADLDNLSIDLLATTTPGHDSALAATVTRAVTAFDEQRRLAGLPVERIHEAVLALCRLPDVVSAEIYRHRVEGYRVEFRAWAVMDNGRRFEKTRVEFVAPFDADTPPPWQQAWDSP